MSATNDFAASLEPPSVALVEQWSFLNLLTPSWLDWLVLAAILSSFAFFRSGSTVFVSDTHPLKRIGRLPFALLGFGILLASYLYLRANGQTSYVEPSANHVEVARFALSKRGYEGSLPGKLADPPVATEVFYSWWTGEWTVRGTTKLGTEDWEEHVAMDKEGKLLHRRGHGEPQFVSAASILKVAAAMAGIGILVLCGLPEARFCLIALAVFLTPSLLNIVPHPLDAFSNPRLHDTVGLSLIVYVGEWAMATLLAWFWSGQGLCRRYQSVSIKPL